MTSRTTERCTNSFRTSTPEDYKNNNFIDLSPAMFFLPKKTGNYHKTYSEKEEKYKDCTRIKSVDKCKTLYDDARNAEKDFKRSLSIDTKNKLIKKIENIKNKDDLNALACYLKLLHNLIASCGNHPSRGKEYISTLKDKLKDKVSPENKISADGYIKHLLESINDSSLNTTFKISDKDFKYKLKEIIENDYKTCS